MTLSDPVTEWLCKPLQCINGTRCRAEMNKERKGLLIECVILAFEAQQGILAASYRAWWQERGLRATCPHLSSPLQTKKQIPQKM